MTKHSRFTVEVDLTQLVLGTSGDSTLPHAVADILVSLAQNIYKMDVLPGDVHLNDDGGDEYVRVRTQFR